MDPDSADVLRALGAALVGGFLMVPFLAGQRFPRRLRRVRVPVQQHRPPRVTEP